MRALIARLKNARLKNADGAEIAEAALVLPVVFVFLLGIVWFGRALNIYSTIQQAAQQGAIVAARPTCGTCGNTPAAAGGACPGTVVCAVTSVMQASNLDPTQIPPSSIPNPTNFCPPPLASGCSTANNISICRQVVLNPSTILAPQAPICGAQVSFQYPFQFYLPFTSLNLSQIILTAQAQSRMEN